MTDARTQAIEYRRQLLRIVDQIERDYGLGRHAPADCGFPLTIKMPELEERFISDRKDVDTQVKKV